MTPGPPVGRASLVSFDGGLRVDARVVRPDRYGQLDGLEPAGPRIVLGGGYSYAGCGITATGLVVDARAFDRILRFDETLGTITCEGATTLLSIHEVATRRGWFLPVQPGYPLITVGGCIAADVHGKNHFLDGTFRRHVREIVLRHPRHGDLTLRPDDPSGAFALTAGGLGLTGLIISATLQLAPLPGPSVTIRRRHVNDLDATPALLEEVAASTSFIYTWHDLSRGGAAFGRGFLYSGDFDRAAPPSRPAAPPRVVRLSAADRGSWRVPLLNRLTTPPFNQAYGWAQARGSAARSITVFDFFFPVARKVDYFRLFGSPGFHEIQLIVPSEAFGTFARDLRAAIDRLRVPITLASCKIFRGEASLLRFDGTGICIALDFPRGTTGTAFAACLDELTLAYGARPNVSKDSRLPRKIAERAFPDYERFRASLEAFDPDRLFRSELSARLGL